MKRYLGFLWIAGALSTALPWAQPALEIPADRPIQKATSIMTFRISLLSAIQEVAMVSTSVTAFRPAELSVGIFNSFKRAGFFVEGGLAVPWKNAEYDIGEGVIREILMTVGYRYVEPGNLFDESNQSTTTFQRPPSELHALTAQVGLEAIEWLNPFFGLDLDLSLGLNFWLPTKGFNRWQGTSDIEPLLDVGVGVAF